MHIIVADVAMLAIDDDALCIFQHQTQSLRRSDTNVETSLSHHLGCTKRRETHKGHYWFRACSEGVEQTQSRVIDLARGR